MDGRNDCSSSPSPYGLLYQVCVTLSTAAFFWAPVPVKGATAPGGEPLIGADNGKRRRRETRPQAYPARRRPVLIGPPARPARARRPQAAEHLTPRSGQRPGAGPEKQARRRRAQAPGAEEGRPEARRGRRTPTKDTNRAPSGGRREEPRPPHANRPRRTGGGSWAKGARPAA